MNNKARLSVVSRHYVKFTDSEGVLRKGVFSSRGMTAVVGDMAHYTEASDSSASNKVVVTDILERKNCFIRSNGSRTKKLAANLDRLFLVTAPIPLFNTSVIDRVTVAAASENIPCTIVLNKLDLEVEYKDTLEQAKLYSEIGFNLMSTSSLKANSFKALENELRNPDLAVVAFIGVSGVGKSSLLNAVCPSANERTGETSVKSGQGRQTTSMSQGHSMQRASANDLFLIDLPGIQNFGICHLSAEQIRGAFPEFVARKEHCRFSNCAHLEEPDCAVKRSLKNKEIASSRYQSYLEMLTEIRDS